MRMLSVYEHGGDCISIYYYREGSYLDQMLTRLTPKRIFYQDVQNIPSYIIYEGLLRSLKQFYKDAQIEPFAANNFRDGFSFIVRGEAKDWVLAYIRGIPYDAKESYEYRSSLAQAPLEA